MEFGLEMVGFSAPLVGLQDDVTAAGLFVVVALTISSRWRLSVPRSSWFVVPLLLLAVGLMGTGVGLAQPEVLSGLMYPWEVDLNWTVAFVSAFDPLRMALMAGGLLLGISACGVAVCTSPRHLWNRYAAMEAG